MNPYVISAQFAAYVWYSNENPNKSDKDAVFFARRNWISFLPCSHQGVGRLLTKIAEPRGSRYMEARPSRTRCFKKSMPRNPKAMGLAHGVGRRNHGKTRIAE
jgi:hypothetical protein